MAKHETIQTPVVGIFAGIPNADYHGGPGISKSGLDIIRRSPMHYKAARDAGPRESTPAQREGTIVHDLVLEPESFWDRYARPFVAPEGALDTVDDIKARLKDLSLPVSGKKQELKERLALVDSEAVFLDDLKDAYYTSVAGKAIISTEELAKAQAMADAINAHPVAGKLLAPGTGDAELSCYWVDEVTGALCRCRPDHWRHDDIIVDLKTTNDASPEGFAKSINDWRYHVQDPFYQDGIKAAIAQSGSERAAPKAFLFVAVEKTAPHAVAVYRLDSESVDIGRREYREDLDTYAACAGSDVWPGYGDRIQAIGLPEWRIRREQFNEEA